MPWQNKQDYKYVVHILSMSINSNIMLFTLTFSCFNHENNRYYCVLAHAELLSVKWISKAAIGFTSTLSFITTAEVFHYIVTTKCCSNQQQLELPRVPVCFYFWAYLSLFVGISHKPSTGRCSPVQVSRCLTGHWSHKRQVYVQIYRLCASSSTDTV